VFLCLPAPIQVDPTRYDEAWSKVRLYEIATLNPPN
jgi:hypothetical protein